MTPFWLVFIVVTTPWLLAVVFLWLYIRERNRRLELFERPLSFWQQREALRMAAAKGSLKAFSNPKLTDVVQTKPGDVVKLRRPPPFGTVDIPFKGKIQ